MKHILSEAQSSVSIGPGTASRKYKLAYIDPEVSLPYYLASGQLPEMLLPQLWPKHDRKHE